MYLGINAFSHDSSACIIDERGKIIAAAEEERFREIKHYTIFPKNAINFCLEHAGITAKDLKGIAIGWSPKELIFGRIVRQYLLRHRPPYIVFKKTIIKLTRLLTIKRRLKKTLGKIPSRIPIKYYRHHIAHAASAFYPSGFHKKDGRNGLSAPVFPASGMAGYFRFYYGGC